MSELQGESAVAYWPDGFFMRDISDAELADSVECFGPEKHKIIEVPDTATDEEIRALISNEIANREGGKHDGNEAN